MYEPFRYMEEGYSRGKRTVTQENEAEVTLNEFRKPRNSVLCIVARFYSHATGRLRELRKILADPTFKMPELLDSKVHNVSLFLLQYREMRFVSDEAFIVLLFQRHEQILCPNKPSVYYFNRDWQILHTPC